MTPGFAGLYSVAWGILLIIGLVFALTSVYVFFLIVMNVFKRPERTGRPIRSFPTITAVIAAKNEAAILPTTITRLLEMPYPKERFSVLVAVDEGDDATTAACLPFSERVRVIHTKSRRGKPGVLNEILPLVESELMLLLDADSLLEQDAFSRMLPPIIEDGFMATSAQGYPLNDREGIIPWFFRVECRIQANLNANKGENGFFAYTPGFGTLILTSEIRRVGGWDETCISEDSDLALRLWATGSRIRDSPALVGMEAPATLSGFIRQRLRWYRGMLDAYRTQGKLLLQVPVLKAVDVSIQFLSPVLVAFFLPFCIGALLAGGALLYLLAAILTVNIVGALIINGTFSVADHLGFAVMIIPFLLLNSAICILVVLTFVLNMRLPWTRTEKSNYRTKDT